MELAKSMRNIALCRGWWVGKGGGGGGGGGVLVSAEFGRTRIHVDGGAVVSLCSAEYLSKQELFNISLMYQAFSRVRTNRSIVELL